MPPHPSGIEPQCSSMASQLVGVQPHVFGVSPPPHVWGAVHVPQSSMPPHPSGIEPQCASMASQLVGVQPHVFGVSPPPHVWGAVHVPQSSMPPHPSGTSPQLASASLQVLGVHQGHGPSMHPAHATTRTVMTTDRDAPSFMVAPPLLLQGLQRTRPGIRASSADHPEPQQLSGYRYEALEKPGHRSTTPPPSHHLTDDQ
jgi:hypothetical protein